MNERCRFISMRERLIDASSKKMLWDLVENLAELGRLRIEQCGLSRSWSLIIHFMGTQRTSPSLG